MSELVTQDYAALSVQPVMPSMNPTDSLIFSDGALDKAMRFAEIMASATVSIPDHLKNKPGDCLAIVLKATQWGINPYSVAEATSLVKGKLCYEGKLVSALINSHKELEGQLKYEWFGDWSKLAKKPRADVNEEGLGITITGKLKKADAPASHTIYLSNVTTRNSGLWATDPKTQIAYLAVRAWARLYASHILLGVYSPDEIDDAPKMLNSAPKSIIPTVVVEDASIASSDELDEATRQLLSAIESTTKFSEITALHSKVGTAKAHKKLLIDAYKTKLASIKDGMPTYEQVVERMNNSPDIAPEFLVPDFVGHLSTDQQKSLTALANQLFDRANAAA